MNPARGQSATDLGRNSLPCGQLWLNAIPITDPSASDSPPRSIKNRHGPYSVPCRLRCRAGHPLGHAQSRRYDAVWAVVQAGCDGTIVRALIRHPFAVRTTSSS